MFSGLTGGWNADLSSSLTFHRRGPEEDGASGPGFVATPTSPTSARLAFETPSCYRNVTEWVARSYFGTNRGRIKSFFVASLSHEVGLDRVGELQALLRNQRVGLLTHAAAVNSSGTPSYDVIGQIHDVRLTCLLGPEHGVSGTGAAG